MLSANALDDLSWQQKYFSAISKIFLNISSAALLAFVLDKLQTSLGQTSKPELNSEISPSVRPGRIMIKIMIMGRRIMIKMQTVQIE